MAQTTTTTTTTTTTSTQVNQQLTVGTSTNSYDLGSYVTDVSIQPYIAPTVVGFVAYNMRPNTRMHVFFNSVNVDAFCAPGILNTSNNVTAENVVLKNGNYGDSIFTDSNGNILGVFNIPATTFKTGTIALEICDVASLVLGNNAISTSASASFTASDISVTKQSITLTTIDPIISSSNVVNTKVSSNSVVSTTVTPDVVINNGTTVINFALEDPIAQLFVFNTPTGEIGGYITSIDLFFYSKSLVNANNGFVLYVCETNNGYPDTSKILPFSTTHINGNSINISNNSIAATNVKFESPVYVNSSTNYAFIVKPDQSDPDLLIFAADLGDIDIATGKQVFSQPNVGTAFEGATTSGWSALQSTYIKFNIYRANFTSLYGQASFNNTSRDHLNINNVLLANISYSILPNDIVFASTNSTINTVSNNINGVVASYDISTNILDIHASTGNFGNSNFIQIHRFANSSVTIPNANTLIASANLTSVSDVKMNVCVPQLASISPAGTQLKYNVNMTSNTFVKDVNTINVNIDSTNEFFDYERLILSKTNENSKLSGQKSFNLTASFVSDSSYLSPLIDTVRQNILSIQNLVDPLSSDLYDELYNYGKSKSKYLSPVITLSSGQNSQNLQVTINAYKPYSSYIKVYAKFLSGEDNDSITNKTWTPLVCDGDNYYSTYGKPSNYITLNYTVSNGYSALQCNGNITISNSSNIITGNNTSFTTDLAVGRYINVSGDYSRKIIAISNNTSLAVDIPFINNWNANAFYLVPPPTTPWLSTNTITQVTGTVSTNTTSNIIVGNNTSFANTFAPGSIIGIANDEQVVISVTNNTLLTVGSPWSSNSVNANVFLYNFSGLNYLNSNNNLYTNYNRFQIKTVLLSDDDANVPILDSVSAIAIQS